MATRKRAQKPPSEPSSEPESDSDVSSMSLEALTERVRTLESSAVVYKVELQARRDKKAQELTRQHERRWTLLLNALAADPNLLDVLCPKHQGDCSDEERSVFIYTELDEDHTCPRCLLLEALRDNFCPDPVISLDFALNIVDRFRPDIGF